MRVLLIGATGLVGELLADRLLARGHEVHALSRRPASRSGGAWQEHVAPASAWPELVTRIARADAAISCLGTTLRKAGSEQGFRAVDHDAVVAFAQAARATDVPHFLSVSSVGAHPRSRNFYLRTKGAVDQALEAIGFARLDIFRPGLLLGMRSGERRPGERFAIALDPVTRLFLRGGWDRFAGIRAGTVAAAIATASERSGEGRFVHSNPAIRALASDGERGSM